MCALYVDRFRKPNLHFKQTIPFASCIIKCLFNGTRDLNGFQHLLHLNEMEINSKKSINNDVVLYVCRAPFLPENIWIKMPGYVFVNQSLSIESALATSNVSFHSMDVYVML